MDLCNRSDIQALLARHGFHFSKSMGQNFLIESWVPAQIADASGADAGMGVLEIGPGIGPLTQQLAQRSGRVVSVELDRRLLPVLAETMAGFDNFTLVEGDAMKMDLRALTAEHFAGLRPILCANLPYNITTPFLTACVQAGCFESLTVLIQKEVAERICAAPGTAAFGAFSLLMQYYTEPELLFTVPNTCFIPAPKVTSAVIRCRTRKTPPVAVRSETMLWRTVRAGFALRRKTLVNSLQTAFPLPKAQLTEIVERCGLEPAGAGGLCASGGRAGRSGQRELKKGTGPRACAFLCGIGASGGLFFSAVRKVTPPEAEYADSPTNPPTKANRAGETPALQSRQTLNTAAASWRSPRRRPRSSGGRWDRTPSRRRGRRCGRKWCAPAR